MGGRPQVQKDVGISAEGALWLVTERSELGERFWRGGAGGGAGARGVHWRPGEVGGVRLGGAETPGRRLMFQGCEFGKNFGLNTSFDGKLWTSGVAHSTFSCGQ